MVLRGGKDHPEVVLDEDEDRDPGEDGPERDQPRVVGGVDGLKFAHRESGSYGGRKKP